MRTLYQCISSDQNENKSASLELLIEINSFSITVAKEFLQVFNFTYNVIHLFILLGNNQIKSTKFKLGTS